MRIEKVVSQFIKDENNKAKIDYLSSLKGGWERWFQLELAYFIHLYYEHYGYTVYTEENIYTNPRFRLDLLIEKEDIAKHYVELKCQVNGEDINKFAEFLSDDFLKMNYELEKGNFSGINIIGYCLDINDAMETARTINAFYESEIAICHKNIVNIFIGQSLD